MVTGAADVLVIFGATGDLARLMTFHSLYRLERRGLLTCPIVAVATDPWSTDDLRKFAAAAIEATGEQIEPDVLDRLEARLSYLSGDLTDADTYRQLAKVLRHRTRPVHYLELPPFLFGRVVRGLYEVGLTRNARVLMEKPFGHDLESAIALANDLHEYIDETQLFRVDHYLGKVGLDELLSVRFANTILEPIWNRNYIDSMQITLAEDFGVAERGHFYDAVGALRDVCATHLLLVFAAGAMEPPAGPRIDAVRDRFLALWRATVPADPDHCVRGQYDGYLDIDGVRPDSKTETYAAFRLDVDNWRWSGVPFFIRAGKRLPALATELRAIFKRPPKLGLGDVERLRSEPNEVVIRLDPSAGLRLRIHGDPGAPPVTLDRELAREGVTAPTPYEVVLLAALRGDGRRFGNEDGIEQRWRIVQPLLSTPPPVHRYPPGTWGPAAAEALLGPHSPWQEPWLDPPPEVAHDRP